MSSVPSDVVPRAVALSMPESHREAVRSLGLLPDEAFGAVIDRLDAYQGEYSFSALVELFTPEVEMADDLANVVSSAYTSLPAFESSLRLAESIAQSSQAAEGTAGRLDSVISARAAIAIGKLLSLGSEAGEQVIATRFITDLRPAFSGIAQGDDTGELDIIGAAVTHTLRVDVASEGKVEALYLGVDTSQLRLVQYQVERALRKEAAVRRRFAGQLPLLKEGE